MHPTFIIYRTNRSAKYKLNLLATLNLFHKNYIFVTGHCLTEGQIEWLDIAVMHEDNKDIGDPSHMQLLNTIDDICNFYAIKKG